MSFDKKAYQRDYMRRKRAGQPTALAKSPEQRRRERLIDEIEGMREQIAQPRPADDADKFGIKAWIWDKANKLIGDLDLTGDHDSEAWATAIGRLEVDPIIRKIGELIVDRERGRLRSDLASSKVIEGLFETEDEEGNIVQTPEEWQTAIHRYEVHQRNEKHRKKCNGCKPKRISLEIEDPRPRPQECSLCRATNNPGSNRRFVTLDENRKPFLRSYICDVCLEECQRKLDCGNADSHAEGSNRP